MAIYLLKKSYQLKNLQEVRFKDLWGDHGIFTTMWIFGKPPKILFFENHIKNMIKSLQRYGIKKRHLHKNILKIINENLSKKIKYKNQSWTLMDLSKSSLNEAKKNIVIKIGTTSIIKNDKVDITLLKSLVESIIENKNKFNFVLK